MTSEELSRNWHTVRTRIAGACAQAQRPADAVALVAVSKKQPAAAVRALYASGQRAFGESYVQEALAKQAELADLAIVWHFIGRVQANKTRALATQFAWVHGLADAVHAQRLHEQRPPELPPLNVCVQVNLSGEATKEGVMPEAVAPLLAQCAQLPRLRVRGLMTLPAPTADEHEQRRSFQALRQLRNQVATPDCALAELSMGMSDDLVAAIIEGATLVRIGTAIFGAR
ncbi:YggS family pyridoxal phosphate-dependent enzyme [Chromatium okenii]|uniref:YggS family pyridoxal phosphate-dependent enzyme n=1 Tax=Chromatium okenii TaxID=61644 RepID=UPI00190344F8|nr:YggS family pyridoxal phosphate-dependent enzyme [Chromatium okenii]